MEYFAYSQKAFVYKYVVMLSDTDQFKHMSFANYLKLMFLATDALFVGCFDEKFLSQCRLKLTSSRMQFKRQTIAGDNILVKVNSSTITNSQISLLHTFVIEGTGTLVGLGRQTFELINLQKNIPVSDLPENIKSLASAINVNEETLIYKY